MGIWDKAGTVKPKQDRDYAKPGRYVMRVDRVKQDKNRTGGEFIAVEMTCLHVIDKEQDAQPHKVGEDASVLFCDYGPGKDYFLPEFTAFVIAATEADASEFQCAAGSPEQREIIAQFAEITGPSQPLAGTIIEFDGKTKVNKQGQPRVYKSFKRRIRPSAVVAKEASQGGYLTDDEIKRFFKPGELEKLVAQEKAEDAALAKSARAA